MKILIWIMIPISFMMSEYSLDFGTNNDGNDWRIVNDDVMGGRSQSKKDLRENSLYFSGNVSLENNGGFASIRSPYDTYDLSEFETVTIRFRGTNRKFALSMDIHRAWYLPNYKHEFTPEGENWQEITVP
ncbi:MAG: CIA30 family protein, partial [Flavobacteriaceae bacterium]|nr:CIA30 family protein [Flavobacteriaceae bacterium]